VIRGEARIMKFRDPDIVPVLASSILQTLNDLGQYSWADGKDGGKLGDLERGIFVFEHTMPVEILIEQLLSLKSPTLVPFNR
jgi:hypothetical protein